MVTASLGVAASCGAAMAASARASSTASDTGAGVESVRAGDATVVDADTRLRPLSRGGSGTEFSIEAPDGASCPGDSEHDSWRVQTFIVPAAVDPGEIPYGADWPLYDQHMYSLYDTITQPVIDYLTVSNDRPNVPGFVDALPPMSFAVFPVGELPDGRYRIGIACTLFYETANYWDTEIVITSKADDEPAKFVWRLASAPAVAPEAESSPIAGWLVLSAIAVFAVGVALFIRRRSSLNPSTLSKEKQ
jgi:hypothetical protein